MWFFFDGAIGISCCLRALEERRPSRLTSQQKRAQHADSSAESKPWEKQRREEQRCRDDAAPLSCTARHW
jgi:hypothetical protein